MAAQNPGSAGPPLNDAPLALPSGVVVRQRNLVVFRGQHLTALTITIQTPTRVADSSRVADEAQEVANVFDQYARAKGIDRITVAVCRSQACLELREPSTEMFHFVRGSDATWVRDHPEP